MKTIPLTQGKAAVVDDADYEWLIRWAWHTQECKLKNRVIWYAVRTEYLGGGRAAQRSLKIYMHREIAAQAGIPWVDHHDGDGLNNQRWNLRSATRNQNMQNLRKKPACSSRFKGVHWNKRDHAWEAYVTVNKKKQRLGYFEAEEDAATAYNTAARRLFGEYALLNNV